MLLWGALLLLCLVLGWSIWLRMRRFRQTWDGTETKSSPLSLAVQELLATAGGIYLSLIMLVSFLKLTIPATISLFELSLDPLASISIGLAIVQPMIYKVLYKN